MLVALVAKQHLLMVGQPGTAKSVHVEALISHLKDAKLFKILFDEYTTADDVFGGLDVSKLSTTGEQVRLTKGMLPEADFMFGDEFFNINSATGHSTHTVVNERTFSQAGELIDVPLRSAFLASNKVNTDQDYAAVWDRVHLRYEVGYLKVRSNKAAMVEAALARVAKDGRRFRVPATTTITLDELDEANRVAMSLPWSQAAKDALLDIQEALSADGIHISPRRLAECSFAAAANAFLHGHDEVKVGDLAIMTAMGWNLLEQRKKATEIILSIADDAMKEALALSDEFDNIMDSFRNMDDDLDTMHKAKKANEALFGLKALTADALTALARTETGTDSNRRLTDLVAQARERQKQIMGAMMGIDPSKIVVN
jgi:MoxR-like ATPase